MNTETTKTRNFELIASEFQWELSEDKTISAWGFNNRIPGPVLRARKGDTLVIKVRNELRQPTVVHWHGIRIPADMDGTDITQQPIPPGGSFEYRFTVPDAGTFWYHSHYRETEQMERGVYGALIVEDELEPVTDQERVLMIDDMKLDKANDFERGNRLSRWIERHDGREGNALLINGREGSVIPMNAGQTERWRIINAASARYFRLFLGGRSFKLIGTDGGLLEAPQELTELLITPGERADILVGPFEEGELFFVESLPYNRKSSIKPKRHRYATVTVGPRAASVASIPAVLRKIEPIVSIDAAITRKVNFSVGASIKRGLDFKVNGELHLNDKPVFVGEPQVWEVSNSSLMDHPFHLHGFFFQVLEQDGQAPAYKAWKDTINLPPRSKTKIAWVPDNRPGSWMYHCHILEHHDAGMMAHFELLDRASSHQQTQVVSHHHHH